MRAALVRGWATRLIVTATAACLAYGLLRFDAVRLPAEGCSPLHGIDPGSRLYVDTWAETAQVADVVLYRDGAGALLLGRVAEAPAGTAADALWVLGEREDCPTRDSRQLGPIRTQQLAGRIVYVQR